MAVPEGVVARGSLADEFRSRTVASLTLEDVICARYKTLLQNHVVEAYKSARLRTFIFALSDCKLHRTASEAG